MQCAVTDSIIVLVVFQFNTQYSIGIENIVLLKRNLSTVYVEYLNCLKVWRWTIARHSRRRLTKLNGFLIFDLYKVLGVRSKYGLKKLQVLMKSESYLVMSENRFYERLPFFKLFFYWKLKLKCTEFINSNSYPQTVDGSSMCLELALEGERLCKSGDCNAGVAFFQVSKAIH